MSAVLSWFGNVRKGLAAALGVVVTLLTVYHNIPFLPSQPAVVGLLGAATVFVTWLVPNKSVA